MDLKDDIRYGRVVAENSKNKNKIKNKNNEKSYDKNNGNNVKNDSVLIMSKNYFGRDMSKDFSKNSFTDTKECSLNYTPECSTKSSTQNQNQNQKNLSFNENTNSPHHKGRSKFLKKKHQNKRSHSIENENYPGSPKKENSKKNASSLRESIQNSNFRDGKIPKKNEKSIFIDYHEEGKNEYNNLGPEKEFEKKKKSSRNLSIQDFDKRFESNVNSVQLLKVSNKNTVSPPHENAENDYIYYKQKNKEKVDKSYFKSEILSFPYFLFTDHEKANTLKNCKKNSSNSYKLNERKKFIKNNGDKYEKEGESIYDKSYQKNDLNGNSTKSGKSKMFVTFDLPTEPDTSDTSEGNREYE